jgi:MFS family permease
MPSLLAFMPLYARHLGVEHIGLFYVLVGITAIIARPLFGHKSDAMGRGPAILLGLAVQFGGFLCIVLAGSLPLIVAGGVLVSLGSAVVSSTSTALAMDLSNPRYRGQSMATFSLSFQLGNGLGALISGALADLVSLRGMYAGSAVITLLGFILLAAAWKSLPRPVKSSSAAQ